MPEIPAELLEALRQSRTRFMTTFPERCRELEAGKAAGCPSATLQPIVHRLAGLAGTIGFPTVSQAAAAFEQRLVSDEGVDADTLSAHVSALRHAFDRDKAVEADWMHQSAPTETPGEYRHRLLLVEDDPDQRQLAIVSLKAAGFDVRALASSETLLEDALAWQPAAIVLDVVLPGIDGLLSCRLLKAEPGLTQVPVVLISSRIALEERLAAINLGASDYLTKPYDFGELVFRVRRLIQAPHGTPAAPSVAAKPEFAPAPALVARRILLADDDPDVMRIVDAQMKAQRFETVLTFDGEAAVQALTTQTFDLALIDLMLPKLTGFEVLQRLRDLSVRPKALVLSARGREEDITRAFDLGADDYVTKPFRPQELAARVVRLLRQA